MRRWIALTLTGALAVTLAACAPVAPHERRIAREQHARETAPPHKETPPPHHHRTQTWSITELAAVDAQAIELQRDERTYAILPVKALKNLLRAYENVLAAANREPPAVDPVLLLEEGWNPNAFALDKDDRPLVTVNLGMVSLLNDDEGMWATVLGHELAHLRKHHRRAQLAKEDWNQKAGGVAVVLLGFLGIPLAPLLSDAATAVAGFSYSREDEREADDLAVTYLERAGYDPQDALRFHEYLAEYSSKNAGGLLSTHPASQERIDAVRRRIAAPPAR